MNYGVSTRREWKEMSYRDLLRAIVCARLRRRSPRITREPLDVAELDRKQMNTAS